MYTLLVIDMQEGFLNYFNSGEEKRKAIHGCKRAVLQAIADGAEIIDVNYRGGYGPTIPEIKNLWKKYERMFKGMVKKVVKPRDGGGYEIMAVEPQHDEFLACGINAGACVRSTVFELKNMYHRNVSVIQDAVANSWGNSDSDCMFFKQNGMLTNFK